MVVPDKLRIIVLNDVDRLIKGLESVFIHENSHQNHGRASMVRELVQIRWYTCVTWSGCTITAPT